MIMMDHPPKDMHPCRLSLYNPTAVAGVVGVRREPFVLHVDAQAQVHQRVCVLRKEHVKQVGALGGANLLGHQLQGKTRYRLIYLPGSTRQKAAQKCHAVLLSTDPSHAAFFARVACRGAYATRGLPTYLLLPPCRVDQRLPALVHHVPIGRLHTPPMGLRCPDRSIYIYIYIYIEVYRKCPEKGR